MKYNININQKELSKYNIDIKDMAIFDYIYAMCASVNKKIDRERLDGYTWINYETLIVDMPALRIKSRNSITPRINKLEKEGLIKTQKKMIRGHRRVFVKLTTLTDSVFISTNTRVRETEKRVRETVQDNNTIDNSTIDTSSKIKNFAEESDEKSKKDKKKGGEGNEINKLIDLFRPVNPTVNALFRNNTQRQAMQELTKIHGMTFQKLAGMIQSLPLTNKEKFAPTITTPIQLRDKLGNLVAYYAKKQPTNIIK